MLLKLAREEVPSLYHEVDVTSKTNKETNKQFGFKSTWHSGGVVTSQGWVLESALWKNQDEGVSPPQQWGWDS